MGLMTKLLMNRKFKNQIRILILPPTIAVVVFIGVFVYLFGFHQVKRNAEYLIANTTRQTAVLFNDKFNLIFGQCNQLSNMTSMWRLVNHSYATEKSTEEYSDIINVYTKIKNIYQGDGILDSIAMKTDHGTQMNLFNDMIYGELKVNPQDYITENFSQNYGYTWINSHTDQIFATAHERQVLTLALIFQNIRRESNGVIVFNMKSSYFENLLSQVEISKNGYAMLLSEDGYLFPQSIHEQYRLKEEELDTLRTFMGQTGSYEFRVSPLEKKSVHFSALDVNHWLLVTVAPQNDIFSAAYTYCLVLGVVLLVFTLILIVLMNYIAYFVAKPIEELSSMVMAFGSDPNVSFKIAASHEVTTLSRGLDTLKFSIEELLEKIKEEQKHKTKLELMILQAQIKPHFLYNTLTSIKHLSDMKENEKASEMCAALVQFYKIGLSNGQEVVNIQTEVEHVRSYLLIQRYRYSNDFDFYIDVSEAIMGFHFLRLTLQPIVENAIYHGIKPKEGFGTIILSGEIREDNVILTVYDDGVGMTEAQLAQLRQRMQGDQNFGIRNVYQRLHLFFNGQVSITFESRKDVYTQVVITFPAWTRSENYL